MPENIRINVQHTISKNYPKIYIYKKITSKIVKCNSKKTQMQFGTRILKRLPLLEKHHIIPKLTSVDNFI